MVDPRGFDAPEWLRRRLKFCQAHERTERTQECADDCSTRLLRRARLPRQSRVSTGRPKTSPTGPPNHQGNSNVSSQEKRVRSLPTLRRLKTPEPRTTPRCSTPIATPGVHLVIDMTSTTRIGPIFVRQSNAVPTPARCCVRKLIDSASAIQVTCEPISSIAAQIVSGDASMVVATRIVVLTSSNDATRTHRIDREHQRSRHLGWCAVPGRDR
jgi:hypothetical protein